MHIMESNDTTIFVSAFGGIAFPWTVVKETIRLAHALSNDGVRQIFFLQQNAHQKWFQKMDLACRSACLRASSR